MQLGRLCSAQDYQLQRQMWAEMPSLSTAPHGAAWHAACLPGAGALFPGLQGNDLKASGGPELNLDLLMLSLSVLVLP